ncbi:hypothetical protein HELRODRAFT_82800, partial [Helobdella robusta]|uniref:GST C-terminal domain-containing protein n=1 Tax=Helobdella robusta TaxID=6412 RepID=T1G4W8_HELRO
WPEDVKLFQPFEVDQILMNEFANCLSVKTFLNMADLKYQIELRSNAEFMSPSREVPFLKVGPILISEFDSIVTFISAKGYSLSGGLTSEQFADVKSYITLTKSTLNNVLLYVMWVHEDNYNMITKQRSGFGYSWPLYKILPWRKRKQVVRLLKEDGWINKSLDQVYAELDKCLQALSNKLGTEEFFFGSKPTELDALVFGYLFTILTTTLIDSQLLEKLKKYENLTEFCQNIHNLYFKNV